MIVTVEVRSHCGDKLIHKYDMDHDDRAQRAVMGEQCRNAFEGGQRIVSYPKNGGAA